MLKNARIYESKFNFKVCVKLCGKMFLTSQSLWFTCKCSDSPLLMLQHVLSNFKSWQILSSWIKMTFKIHDLVQHTCIKHCDISTKELLWKYFDIYAWQHLSSEMKCHPRPIKYRNISLTFQSGLTTYNIEQIAI